MKLVFRNMVTHIRLNSFFILINFLFLSNCFGYSPSSSDYWENLVGINQSMHQKFYGTNINAILMGSLNPKDEDLLFATSENKLYLGVEAKKSGKSWIVKKTKSSNPKAEFTNKTTYTKILSGKSSIESFDWGCCGS